MQATEISKAKTEDLLLAIYEANRSLKKFGKHPANTEIRAGLEAEKTAAEAELKRRNVRWS